MANNNNFVLLNTFKISDLQLTIEEYEHKKLKTKHYHLIPKQNLTQENVFMVALKTLPQDDTGVAHILEHTVLCGSERYPVRDPFFTMLKRSIQTFMNAMTGSDFTCYPFASQNKQDFNNLLDVYMDAVFFSKIDKKDFLQEGWRVEFENGVDSDLVYKGVVFNEMKGAMSDSNSEVWHDFCKHFYSDSTYKWNSGGLPSAIPDLSYEQLKGFYNSFYHPSNAVFFTYGDISASELQMKFEELALNRFEYLENKYNNFKESRTKLCNRPPVYSSYASDEQDSNHILLGWLMADVEDVKENMRLEVMYHTLMMDSSAPLLSSLEDSGIGTVSPLCMFDSSHSQSLLVIGLDGVEQENVSEAIDILNRNIAELDYEGLDSVALTVLKQLKLDKSEIGGSGYPYALQLMFEMLPLSINGGNPVQALKFDFFDELEKEILAANGSFVKGLVEKYVLNNETKLLYVSRSDSSLAVQRIEAERLSLQNVKSGLAAAAANSLIEQAKELELHQDKKENLDILPKILVKDVHHDVFSLAKQEEHKSYGKLYKYEIPTNGVFYAGLKFDLMDLTEEEYSVFELYMNFVLELGVGVRDYKEEQKHRNELLALLESDFNVGVERNSGKLLPKYTFMGKTVKDNAKVLLKVLMETLNLVRFDEVDRIKYLLQEMWQNTSSSVGQMGSTFAKFKALQYLNQQDYINELVFASSSFKYLKELMSDLDGNINQFIDTIKSIHNKVVFSPRTVFVLGSDGDTAKAEEYFDSALLPGSVKSFKEFSAPVGNKVAMIADTQINYVHSAYKAPQYFEEDSPKVQVLAAFLANKYTHPMIREKGGAYGGRCHYSNNAIMFSSYRDPRLLETLSDYREAVKLLISTPHTNDDIEQAILRVVQDLDKPLSPIGSVSKDLWYVMTKRDPSFMSKYKEAVLSTTIDDVVSMARKYLLGKESVDVIFTNSGNMELLNQEGFIIDDLTL